MTLPAESSQSPVPHPTIEGVLADPAVSLWLRNALRSALERDPVDAANDAEMLLRLLDDRLRALLKQQASRGKQFKHRQRGDGTSAYPLSLGVGMDLAADAKIHSSRAHVMWPCSPRFYLPGPTPV